EQHVPGGLRSEGRPERRHEGQGDPPELDGLDLHVLMNARPTPPSFVRGVKPGTGACPRATNRSAGGAAARARAVRRDPRGSDGTATPAGEAGTGTCWDARPPARTPAGRPRTRPGTR